MSAKVSGAVWQAAAAGAFRGNALLVMLASPNYQRPGDLVARTAVRRTSYRPRPEGAGSAPNSTPDSSD